MGSSAWSAFFCPGWPAVGQGEVVLILPGSTGVSDHYARARGMQMELRSDELPEIADDGSNDRMEVEAQAD
jgi:hypothetical protein